jgi:lysophospholipase L1-like esterase
LETDGKAFNTLIKRDTGMKTTLLLSILIFLMAACNQSGNKKFIPADNNNIAYIGRFDLSDKTSPVFMYSGSMIRTVFNGTSIEMILKDDSLRNMFNVRVDDSLFVLTTNKPDGVYLLAKNLENRKHTLEIYRRTEWHGGNTTFKGFNIDKGKKLYKPLVQKRMIEFIGDSYTCGYGNEGKSREEHFRYETENNYLTYGSLTARALDAEYLTVCRSGIGIWQGYGGDTAFTMPKLYDQVIINSPVSWNFKRYQPQAVVIDLGGNDLSAPLDSATFVNTYVGFLKRIRNNYRTSRIVCIAGPDSPGTEWEKWRSLIHSVVNQFERADPMVSYFEFTPFQPNGSDWHPNTEEHKRMANELIPFLKDLMRW